MLGIGIGIPGNFRGVSAPVTDVDAAAWAAKVTTDGGTYTAPQLAALSAFITSAKANSYWTKLRGIVFGNGADLPAGLVGRRLGAWVTLTNIGPFVGADFTAAGGFDSGASGAKGLRFGSTDSALMVADDSHYSYYMGGPVSTKIFTMGCENSGSFIFNEFLIPAAGSPATLKMRAYDGAAGGDVSGSTSIAGGLVVGTRRSSTDAAIYARGVLVASLATARTGSFPGFDVGVMGTIVDGANSFAGNANNAPCRFASVGVGLTAGDVANLTTDVQTYQTALGRAI